MSQQVNLQVRISEQILQQIEKISDLSRSEFVRTAVQEKLRKEMDSRMEQEWITALKNQPEDKKDKNETEIWFQAEDWD